MILLIKNKSGMSMISIFILISVLAIFGFTLIELVNRQLDMRENSKNHTAINYIAESALAEVMNVLRLRPDKLKNIANVYEGATISEYSSRMKGYYQEDIIGAYYSLELPGKFKFEDSDTQKSITVKLNDVTQTYLLGINHEEGSGSSLKIFISDDGNSYDEIFDAQSDSKGNEITGTQISIEFEEPINVQYIRFFYGNVLDKEIDEAFVYTTYYYDEGEILTDFSDAFNKYVYNYKIIGNKIYITARFITKETVDSHWKINSSYSLQGKYMIDSGGNLVIYDKKLSDTILPFPQSL